MSLTPMAPSAWRYYAEEIADGREDYYAVAAERPGLFLGRGAESLGIANNVVSAIALERLFGHGADPRDGSPLGRGFVPENPRAVAGFALTYSPPLSRIRDNGGYAESVIMPSRGLRGAIGAGRRVVATE